MNYRENDLTEGHDNDAKDGDGKSAGGGQTTTPAMDPQAISRYIKAPGPAPVHRWDPPYCGEMDMRIARDGTWYHEGTPIRRPALVRLFASVLKREGDRYFLVTPVEKVGIQVEDCPFVAGRAEISERDGDQVITLTLNTDEQLVVGQDHEIRVTETAGTGDHPQPHPVVTVRQGLEALLSRPVFYQLVDLAECREVDGRQRLGVWSAGRFFELGTMPG